MTDNSCEPSPNTGTTAARASLNSLKSSRSRSPYTVGGRTIVQGTGVARTSSSAASLLRPYGVTGAGGRLSSIGCPGSVGPAAASDETYRSRRGGSTAAASSTLAVPSRFAAMNAAGLGALTRPATW